MDAAPQPRTEMCPSSGQSRSSAEGQWRASLSLCELGTTRSRPPCRNRVGAITCAESNPHGVTVAKSSSISPPGAVLRRRTDDADEPGPLGFERSEIGRYEPRIGVLVSRRLVALLRLASLRCGAQRCHAGGRHAREKVESLGAERRQPGHADHVEDPFRQQRAARQGMRTTAGMAHYREPIYA
jgi:hypothetical protein